MLVLNIVTNFDRVLIQITCFRDRTSEKLSITTTFSLLANEFTVRSVLQVQECLAAVNHIRIYHECEDRIENPSQGLPFGITRLAE